MLSTAAMIERACKTIGSEETSHTLVFEKQTRGVCEGEKEQEWKRGGVQTYERWWREKEEKWRDGDREI